ncbi:MAG: AmmeMemoRadiSam system protein B [Lentisphaerae bacterium]|nr:AmmeMemoRadiSam system protein B [Lentisphaerota bacterium]
MKSSRSGRHPSNTILASTLAGAWYPGRKDDLVALIHGCLAAVPPVPAGEPPPNVLVLPHAGYAYSAATAAYGIARILRAPFRRVVLLAPSHRVRLRNRLLAPEAAAVSTPLGVIPVDHPFIAAVAQGCALDHDDAVHAAEHSAQIQYPLLQTALDDFRIAPLIVGEMDAEARQRAARALRSLMDNETLLVISTDFTHYGVDFGFAPFSDDVFRRVEELDRGAYTCLQDQSSMAFNAYLDRTGATICGRHPLSLMLEILPRGAGLTCLHYATSSEETRDDSRFVCYLCMAGRAAWPREAAAASPETGADWLSDADKRLLLQFARRAIRQTLDRRRPCPADAFAAEASEAVQRPAGCFVTLKMKATGELRGCIGEMTARRPLYQAVTEMAVHAAFGDPRFPELRSAEWDRVSIEVSVLTPPRPVDSWREIELGRHGMTLAKNGCSAVFLPQVAPEQGWTLEETLTHLARKAGLSPADWREGAAFTVFEAIVWGEEEAG